MYCSPARDDAILAPTLLQLDPQDSRLPALLSRVKGYRSEGRWGTTQENAPSRLLLEIPATLLELHPACGALEGTERHGDGPWIDYRESQLPDFERSRRVPRDRPPRSHPVADFLTPASRPPSFPVGSRVRHPQLGEGIVRKVEGSGESEKVTVTFPVFGLRKLAVRVAPLTRIGSA